MTIPSLLLLTSALVFLLGLTMNLVRKNTTMLSLYVLQSLACAAALIALAYSEGNAGLLYSGVLTLLVKGIMAPTFLSRMIRKYSAHFSAASYLSIPLTLIVMAITTAFTYALVSPALAGYAGTEVPLLLAAVFSSLFLMINKRGVLGQIVAILALENGIVLLAAFMGLQHSFALEFAIAFDIAAWTAIATVFLGMMHRQFGRADTDVRMMSKLTEE
ncbi:hypothetical protein HY418_03605 [Candidatus Kaiserbacteria bacterium]|nr:hypothetical protein [Candidatus Kaiserbacteria bacterium]